MRVPAPTHEGGRSSALPFHPRTAAAACPLESFPSYRHAPHAGAFSISSARVVPARALA